MQRPTDPPRDEDAGAGPAAFAAVTAAPVAERPCGADGVGAAIEAIAVRRHGPGAPGSTAERIRRVVVLTSTLETFFGAVPSADVADVTAVNGLGYVALKAADGGWTTFEPPLAHTFAHGWSGVALQPEVAGKVVLARYYQRMLAVGNDGRWSRTAYLPNPPHRVQYTPSGQVAVVAGQQLLLWDERVGENGGIVQRAKVRPLQGRFAPQAAAC